MADINQDERRRFAFLLCSARGGGNSEALARLAARGAGGEQTWLRLTELDLSPFEDIRHNSEGRYPHPTGDALKLLEATLRASDIVFVAPLYWYGLPAAAKLYLDHWSGWMRVPDVAFKSRMAGKTMWAITAYSEEDPARAEPLFQTLRFSAGYMQMHWGGQLLGYANRPGDIEQDKPALASAASFFARGAHA